MAAWRDRKLRGTIFIDALQNISPARAQLQRSRELNRAAWEERLGNVTPCDREVGILDTVSAYEEFFEKALLQNRPFLVKNVADSWRATAEWALPGGRVAWQRLAQDFGTCRVPVALCGEQQFNDQRREEMTVGEFVARAVQGEEQIYLKDWHLVQQEAHYCAYDVPLVVSDDWINAHWDHLAERDDYRFVYAGTKGSFTPLHCDVFHSFSWSVNVVGRKLWTFFPPASVPFVHNEQGTATVWDIRSPDVTMFPLFEHAFSIEVVQEAGELIFVPAGWYHQVENLEDTVSINHNWGNACNIDLFWDFLCHELQMVEHELSDCRPGVGDEEWTALCQRVLLANSGIDCKGFSEYTVMSAMRQLELLGDSVGKRMDNAMKALNSTEAQPELSVLFSIVKVDKLCKEMMALEGNNVWRQSLVTAMGGRELSEELASLSKAVHRFRM